MLKAIIGRKIGTMQLFKDDGECVPVSVISAGPCVVTQIKAMGKDGYLAVQLGYDPIEMRKLSMHIRGHLSKAKRGGFRVLKEIRLLEKDALGGIEVGSEIRVGVLSDFKKVDVIGTSKGKGFQGVIKRHNFKGGKASHGSMFHRAPGSIGSGSDPSKVWKGQKLPGRMGGSRVTELNLDVVRIDEEKNLALVKGSIPGQTGSIVIVRKAIKGK